MYVVGPNVGDFKFLLILDLWGISFHAVVVIGLVKDLLFKSGKGDCDVRRKFITNFRSSQVGLVIRTLKLKRTKFTAFYGIPMFVPNCRADLLIG